MKNHVQISYENIREMITKNVDTIIMLVDQAQALEKIVTSINGEADQELKAKLEGQLKSLKSTIGTLVEQTDELFKSYDAMVEESFSHGNKL
jgi:ElaB/YqjD/DUF883 family membrane-anchored ribosome-binding protein